MCASLGMASVIHVYPPSRSRRVLSLETTKDNSDFIVFLSGAGILKSNLDYSLTERGDDIFSHQPSMHQNDGRFQHTQV